MTAKAPIAAKTDKESLLELAGMLPEHLCAPARKLLLEYVEEQDRVLWTFLTAPEDDEPESEEERLAVEEGRKDLAEGRWISGEEIKRRLRDSL